MSDLGEIALESSSLDELIVNATLKDLPEIVSELSKIEHETERAILIEKIAKKFSIGKRSIQADIKKLKKDLKESEPCFCANYPGLVDIITDEEENIAFLVKNNKTLFIERKHLSEESTYLPPENSKLPFILPRAKYVLQFYSINDPYLFQDILTYFKKFSYLTDRQRLLVTLTVFLTYIQDHADIHYLPILLFYAVPERGKTRTGKAFILIAYRGIHIVDLREANLFRYSQDYQATLFFDIRDLWKKAERGGAEDILLLRYERGAKVSRVLYPEKGAFKDMVHYAIFGPTIISTNEAVHKILDTRCIPIIMSNRPGEYESPTPEKAQELKDRLTAWRAKVINEPLPEIEAIPELVGRLWDISKPLLQVCKLVYPEGLVELVETLKGVADQRLEDKKDSIEGQIISVIYDLSPEGIPEWTIKTQDILNILNEKRPENYKLSSQYVGIKLKAIGIKTRKVHGYSEAIIKKSDFDTYLLQYGIICEPSPVETLPNSTIEAKQGISTVCIGRELVESQENATQTLPTESLDNKGLEGMVESGRELQDAGTKKILRTLEVVE